MSTQAQIQFEVSGGAPSQCDIIRDYLMERPFEWVSLPTLHNISGSLAVATRVSNLNKSFKDSGQKLPFENYTDLTVKPRQSSYRYAPTSE